MVEGTAAAFANTWKTQAACPNVKNSLEDPCSLSVENGMCVQQPRGPTWCWGPRAGGLSIRSLGARPEGGVRW